MAETPRTDDPTIPDEAVLWRRIRRSDLVSDEKLEGLRISSAVFSDSSDGSGTSVDLADVVLASGRTTADVLAAYPGFGLVALTAGDARAAGQAVVRDALPENPAHALIVGRKNKRVQRELAARARIIVFPAE